MDRTAQRPGGAPGAAVRFGCTDSSESSAQPSERQEHSLAPLLAEFDDLLCGLWPSHLIELLDPENPRPLAIGIDTHVAERLGLDPPEQRRLGRLFRRWCLTAAYLKALRNPGAQRHNLDGQAVEPVDPEHQRHAREHLFAKREKWRRRDEAAAKAEAKAAAKASLRRANSAKPRLTLGGPGR